MRALHVPALTALCATLAGAASANGAPPVKQVVRTPPAAPARAAPQAPAAAPRPAAPPEPVGLTVAIPPGPAAEGLRAMLAPYAQATATQLGQVPWDGAGLDGFKPPPPDLVVVSGEVLQGGCKTQALLHLDWGVLNRDRFLTQASSDCGAGAYVTATALAWDMDKLAVTPHWTDFWDVARYPGGRGLQRTVRGNLEIALLADGVSPGDVYRTLRSNDGLERAFRKLDQLKPYIIWWDKPEQPAQFLAAGHVLMTSSPAGSVLRASEGTHRHYGLQWQDSLGEVVSWAIPQGAAHQAAAMSALLIVSDIARQADFARATGLGPSTHGAVDLLPPAVRAGSPSATGNLAGSLQIDDGFWLENQTRLSARFIAWAAK